MDWHERLKVDPQILTGKPIVKGTRIAVELIADLVASGWSEHQILDSYPALTEADIHACLEFEAANDDAAWRETGRPAFEAAYAPEDFVYELLLDEPQNEQPC